MKNLIKFNFVFKFESVSGCKPWVLVKCSKYEEREAVSCS
jgi:hypothetical protein